MRIHSVEGSGGNNHASTWKRIFGSENRMCLKFGEGKSVSGVELGIECWGPGPLGDDKDDKGHLGDDKGHRSWPQPW